MAKCKILVGPTGSGKSTHAKQLQAEYYTRSNQDDQGKAYHLEYFRDVISMGHNIVVDRMNFNKEQRNRYLQIAKAAGYETEIIVFHESQETCLYRCMHRDGHPTIKTREDALKALHFFFSHYERVEDSEADVVTRIWPDILKPKALICDLDGTLCNIDHRLKWMKTEKKHYPQFFAGIKDDTVNEWCRDLLTNFSSSHSVVLCSGRGKEYYDMTYEWLVKNEINYFDRLLMREKGDFRKDNIVKEIILDFEILTRYEPYFMIDDRQQVVDMWRKRGYTCLQCAKGNF